MKTLPKTAASAAGECFIARVSRCEDGSAQALESIQNPGECHTVVGHGAEVPALREGDSVVALRMSEGVVVLQRLRALGEAPRPAISEADGMLVLEAGRGVVIRTGESVLELTADGKIKLDGKQIYTFGEQTVQIFGANIHLN